MKKIILAIGTGLGVGYFPFFPGTVGSLWGVLIYLLVGLFTISIWWHLSIAIGVILLGVWVSKKCEKILGKKDHPSIVIDEIAGFLVCMIGIPFSPIFLILGFVLFRLFDIVKPFHIDKLQNLPGGWGIVTDDLAAGLLANLFLRALISMADLVAFGLIL